MQSMLGTRKCNHFKLTLLQRHFEFTELIYIISPKNFHYYLSEINSFNLI